MVIPDPEDATHYRLLPHARAVLRGLSWGARRRFAVTMQSPGLAPAHNDKPNRRIPPRREDDPPLYKTKLSDIWVIYSRAEDGSPIVHDLYIDPDSPFPH